MKKILLLFALLFFVFPVKAQETLIVRGNFESPNRSWTNVSCNFQRNLFCYFEGNFIVPRFRQFFTFKVDSVISGSFKDFNNEIRNPPFNLSIALINESIILDLEQNYTLQISRFPHTNYYYLDNLNQVFLNRRQRRQLANFHRNHERNINILTRGSLQRRRDFLAQTLRADYERQYNRYMLEYRDFRYISYIIPYMTSQDSVVRRMTLHQSCIDSRGRRIPCPDPDPVWEEKQAYSDFLYDYLSRILPFALPPKTTDSIGWHKWYESLFSRDVCFPYVEYVQSERREIVIGSLFYFIADIENIHISTAETVVRGRRRLDIRRSFVLNINTDELVEKELPQDCNVIVNVPSRRSFRNNEVAVSWWQGIERATLIDGTFCRQGENIPLEELRYGNGRVRPSLIVHSNDDFLVFYPGAVATANFADDYVYLKAGKIDRNGQWIIAPRVLYRNMFKNFVGDGTTVRGLSFHQSCGNDITLAFSDQTGGERVGGKILSPFVYTHAIFIYRVNTDLEVKDSVIIATGSKYFFQTYLLKQESTYLLLAKISHGNDKSNRLYYKLLNDDLTPKTDFVRIATQMNRSSFTKPIVTSEGFMISWVDNDLSENLLRSILIHTSGKQSDIINVTKQQADKIFNVEVDKNTVDIYFHSRLDGSLIRKRINKSEFGL